MTIEEKAKAYDDALERAKKLIDANGLTEGSYPNRETCETIFPELAESEDERIRKEIKQFILDTIGEISLDDKENAWLVWLEKQKEPKPVEPSNDELQRHQDELYDFKVFAAKQAREHHISFVHDFEWNNFCAELLSYFNEKQKPAEWKPLPESMEALLLAIEGKWDAIKPTGYMSRRLEDLYDGLVNTFDVDEKYIGNLPKTEYTEKDIEEIKALKEELDSPMETKSVERSEEDEIKLASLINYFEGDALDCSTEDMVRWLKSL